MAEIFLGSSEELTMPNPVKYEVKLYADDVVPLISLTTFDGWNIEGAFLCIYRDGVKYAHFIPAGVHYIETVAVKPDPLTDPIETLNLEADSIQMIENKLAAVHAHLNDPIDQEEKDEVDQETMDAAEDVSLAAGEASYAHKEATSSDDK
jgi:hypothetical protein